MIREDLDELMLTAILFIEAKLLLSSLFIFASPIIPQNSMNTPCAPGRAADGIDLAQDRLYHPFQGTLARRREQCHSSTTNHRWFSRYLISQSDHHLCETGGIFD